MTEWFVASIIVIAIAEIVTLAFFKRGNRQQQVAALSPEQRALHDAEASHASAVRQAQQKVREATAAYEKRVQNAEKALRGATQARDARVAKAEAVLASAKAQGQGNLGFYRGKKGTVTLWEDRVETPDGVAHFANGVVDATVDSDGKKGDTFYLTVKAPNIASVVPCNPSEDLKAREFAVRIYNASRAYDGLRQAKERAIGAATSQLDMAHSDRTAIEKATADLAAARADRQAVEAAAATLEQVRSDRRAIEQAQDNLGVSRDTTIVLDTSLSSRQKTILGTGAIVIALITTGAAFSAHADAVKAAAHERSVQRAQAIAHQTAVARAHATVTVEARLAARAHATAVAQQQIRARAQATAQARAQATRTAMERAQATAQAMSTLKQQQADIKDLMGRIYGIEDECDDAGKVASGSLTAIANGTGDAVQAYQDAQNAHDACNQAGLDGATLNVPDSLSGFHLDNVTADLAGYVGDIADRWDDVKKVIENPNDVASAADAKNKVDQANSANIDLVGAVGEAAISLKVDIRSIPHIPPSH